MAFEPNYKYLLDSAYNKEAARTPLYEHIISDRKMGEILNRDFYSLEQGNAEDLREYFKTFSGFYKSYGYDTVSYEVCAAGFMPGSGCLGNSKHPPAIRDMADLVRYPWEQIPEAYFRAAGPRFKALAETMPAGMKAVGGVGNGVFESVQDLTGYENLCYIAEDDPELYAALFQEVGKTLLKIWQRFLAEYSDAYCVMRFGDDMGFRSATLLSPADIKTHILPQYKAIVAEVHKAGKPFLLHSCGQIFDVMDDLINLVGINAKHSNEDQIAPFPVWVQRYGDKIGNFGGIDTDAVCRLGKAELKTYITDVFAKCKGHGGFAFGSGNSIPDYVPAGNFLAMNEIARECRGEK